MNVMNGDWVFIVKRPARPRPGTGQPRQSSPGTSARCASASDQLSEEQLDKLERSDERGQEKRDQTRSWLLRF